jgi:hypothetical protein
MRSNLIDLRAVIAVVAGMLAACSANDDTPAPQISSISPNHAVPGTTVLISGSYFCHQPANEDPLACANTGAVEFGTSVANATQYMDTSITVEVPGAVGTVRVVVEVSSETSNGVSFTFD